MTDVARRSRLSKEQAHELGLIPTGHGWDEDLQQAVPIGMMVHADAIRRGVDITEQLSVVEKNRKAIVRFVENQMEESEYKPDGYPVAGKMHDFYRLPNYDKKALTKQGAEKLAQLARLRRSRTASIERQCTKEFTMAVVQVDLVDPYGQPAGSGEAACTTAETGFQKSIKKYGGDFRAALNDVVARAGKRAFVQALIYATATDEIFDSTGDVTKAAEGQGAVEEVAAYRLPESPKLGGNSGRLVKEMKTEDLVELRDRMKARMKNPGTWQPVLDAIDEELDSRRTPPKDEDSF